MGGRAIQRAVTRVKSEQAPKVLMRMPTRHHFGEGRANGKVIDMSTRSICRRSGRGTSEKVVRVIGETRLVRG